MPHNEWSCRFLLVWWWFWLWEAVAMSEDFNKRTKRTEGTGRDEREGFIPVHGGYAELHSFQKARIVYDGTAKFCERFVDRRSRTHDQMVQAARSGKQNILEGSKASGTSRETELKLTNVARASLEELLEDYRDFLRVRGIAEWPREHSHTRRLRELNRQPNANYATFKKGIEHPDPAIAANVMIGLIKLTNYLLDQQLRRLEQDFLKDVGLRERMSRARLAARSRKAQ
jgi:four helix bundle suffix protein